jgi:hypothetical protein
MPKFLSREEIYRILQRELPEKVYPDGPPAAFYSTADMDAVADVVATGYANLERQYENNWPQTADERIQDWEIKVFGAPLSAALSLAERRDRVVTQLRSRKGIRNSDMKDAVQGIIGSDKLVDISEWGCSTGGWILNVSELSISTILNGQNGVDFPAGIGPCGNPADYGKTPEEWAEMQEEAYTFQVNIYGYTLTDLERETITQTLIRAAPARSNFVIVDGQDPMDMIDGDNDVDVNLSQEDGGLLLLEDGGELLTG